MVDLHLLDLLQISTHSRSRMQANVVEHVRWRPTDAVDPASRGCIAHMRAVLHDANKEAVLTGEEVPDTWDLVQDRVDRPYYLRRLAPGTASAGLPKVVLKQRPAPVSPGDFLRQAATRSPGVVALHSAPKHGEKDVRQALRKEYSKLFEHFPDTTSQKFLPGQLDTASGRAHALVQLATSLHKGEVAELDPELTRWRLVAKAPGSASAPTACPQFYCVEGGSPVRRPPEQCYEFGRPLLQAVGWSRLRYSAVCAKTEITRLQRSLQNEHEKEHSDYEPDWSQQRYRGRLMVLSFESKSRSGRRPIAVSGLRVGRKPVGGPVEIGSGSDWGSVRLRRSVHERGRLRVGSDGPGRHARRAVLAARPGLQLQEDIRVLPDAPAGGGQEGQDGEEGSARLCQRGLWVHSRGGLAVRAA